MRRSFGSLIIFRPASSRILRLNYTRRAIRLLIIGTVIGLGLLIAARLILLPPIPEDERARLQRENDLLKTQNRNLEIEAERLQYRISHLEETSKRMTQLASGAD